MSQRSLNHVQHWALDYWMDMTRRDVIEDEEAKLEVQCFNLFPERWKQIYDNSGSGGDYGQAFGGEAEIPVTDPADLDKWFNDMAAQRGMTGADAERMFGPQNEMPFLGYAEGEGRRV